jgi:hypothetical protein
VVLCVQRMEGSSLVIDKCEILEARSSFALLPRVGEKSQFYGTLRGINPHEELTES